jgi:hypothetical protein
MSNVAVNSPELPSWALPHKLVASLSIPLATPSGAALAKLRPAEYKVLREKWKALLRACSYAPKAPLPKVGLVVIRNGARTPRWDSAFAGLRPITDCLVMADTAHPDGLGYIVDDSRSSGMPYAPCLVLNQVVAAQESTVVQLYDVS